MPLPLKQLGENAVLQRLLPLLPEPRQLLVGPGDDCAVVPRDDQWDTLLKTDAVIEAVHFTPDTPPELIGRKALARAISDIAAMGGIPEHALITVLIHPSRPISQLEGIYRGLSELARQFGVSVAGGETSSLPYDGLALNIALTGRVERGKAILRSHARPGDILCVTGLLGGSFGSGRHLTFTPRVKEARAMMKTGFLPTAMMDLSDGLGTDLPRLAAASHCGFECDLDSIPCHEGCSTHQAICDGEDYELLLTLSPENYTHLSRLQLLPLFAIGKMTEKRGTRLPEGWQHFCA